MVYYVDQRSIATSSSFKPATQRLMRGILAIKYQEEKLKPHKYYHYYWVILALRITTTNASNIKKHNHYWIVYLLYKYNHYIPLIFDVDCFVLFCFPFFDCFVCLFLFIWILFIFVFVYAINYLLISSSPFSSFSQNKRKCIFRYSYNLYQTVLDESSVGLRQ